MNWDLANLVGVVGSVLMIAAYAYSNLAARIDFRLFNALNLLGSLLLVLSLMVHFNLASMLLEVIWALIAAFGLVRTFLRKSPA